jgi:hypothetical protein
MNPTPIAQKPTLFETAVSEDLSGPFSLQGKALMDPISIQFEL